MARLKRTSTASGGTLKHYSAPPTAKRMHLSNAMVRIIRGPVGSGKSTSCIQDLFMRIAQQEAHPVTKVRSSRALITRDTYNELEETTVKTFRHWFPEEMFPFVGYQPATCIVQYALGDGTRVEAEIIFMALGEANFVDKLKSLELTFAYVNEAQLMAPDLIAEIQKRTNRYPPVERDRTLATDREPEGPVIYGPTWCGVIADMNSTYDDHWMARLEADPPEGWEFFIQPPALLREYDEDGATIGFKQNPEAENIQFIGNGIEYYFDIVKNNYAKKEQIVIMDVENKYASAIMGQGVYTDYWDERCILRGDEQVEPIKGHLVVIGLDSTGLNPAAIFFQVQAGTLVLLDELFVQDIAFKTFTDEVLVKFIEKNYRGVPIHICSDPANPRDNNEALTPQYILQSRGFKTSLAATNDIPKRLEAVFHFLEKPDGFKVNERCTMSIAGFRGKYQYKMIKVYGMGKVRSDHPLKNEYANVHDAIQYGCMRVYAAIVATIKKRNKKRSKQRVNYSVM